MRIHLWHHSFLRHPRQYHQLYSPTMTRSQPRRRAPYGGTRGGRGRRTIAASRRVSGPPRDVLGALRAVGCVNPDRAVLESEDWRRRVFGSYGAQRAPPTWNDSTYLRKRHDVLAANGMHRLDSLLNADVPYAEDAAEAEWAEMFWSYAGAAHRCADLAPLDIRLLFGVAPPGVGGATLRHNDYRCTERKIRHSTGRLVPGHEYRAEYMRPPCLSSWPHIPPLLARYEVPFMMYAPTPLVVRLYGLTMNKWPAHSSLKERKPFAWALWCATSTLFIRDVVSTFLDALAQGRLFWLSQEVLDAIKELGAYRLAGTNLRGELLVRALMACSDIAWVKVDAAASIRPIRNLFSGPIYPGGDYVPWDPHGRARGGNLCTVPELLQRDGVPRMWRGPRIHGSLEQYREPVHGFGRRFPNMLYVPVHKARLGGPNAAEILASDFTHAAEDRREDERRSAFAESGQAAQGQQQNSSDQSGAQSAATSSSAQPSTATAGVLVAVPLVPAAAGLNTGAGMAPPGEGFQNAAGPSNNGPSDTTDAEGTLPAQVTATEGTAVVTGGGVDMEIDLTQAVAVAEPAAPILPVVNAASQALVIPPVIPEISVADVNLVRMAVPILVRAGFDAGQRAVLMHAASKLSGKAFLAAVKSVLPIGADASETSIAKFVRAIQERSAFSGRSPSLRLKESEETGH